MRLTEEECGALSTQNAANLSLTTYRLARALVLAHHVNQHLGDMPHVIAFADDCEVVVYSNYKPLLSALPSDCEGTEPPFDTWLLLPESGHTLPSILPMVGGSALTGVRCNTSSFSHLAGIISSFAVAMHNAS